MQTISSYIKEYSKNIDTNIEDTLRIISFCLNIPKEKLFMQLNNRILENKEMDIIKSTLDRYYINFEPIQYIIGVWPFFNEEYIVNSNVLVPRCDSEILVETAIKYINKNDYKNILDMCTGSGAIGISISKNTNIFNMTLADISKEALEVTQKNIIKNNVQDICKILKSDLFNNIESKYDMIVSNPPYIPSSDINRLSSYVKNEPYIALDGGEDGLSIYKRIFYKAREHLNNNGYLIIEIGFDQKYDIINIIKKYREYEYIECIKDLGKNDRVIVCRFHQI